MPLHCSSCYDPAVSDEWDRILDGVLRPARPERARCLRALDEYQAARDDHMTTRSRALAEIEARIGDARERALAADDGVVTSEMTRLERAWREASRATPSTRDLERLWARVAPARWLDAPRRVAGPAEAVVALCSDPDGVETAEGAVASLRGALRGFQVEIGPRIEWWVATELTFAVRAEALLAGPAAALARVATHAATQHAHRRRREVRERLRVPAVSTRNSSIARELGFLAFASALWADAAPRLPGDLAATTDPFGPALAIWGLGYVLTGADASGVVLTALPL